MAVIRKARRTDLAGIVKLWREMWDLHSELDSRLAAAPDERAMRDVLTDHYEGDDSCILVAEEEQELVGYCLGVILENPPVEPDPRFGYVSDLAVTASARGRGLGAKLLDETHAWFKSRGVARAEVQVSTLNPRAAAFWKDRGYADFLLRLRKPL